MNRSLVLAWALSAGVLAGCSAARIQAGAELHDPASPRAAAAPVVGPPIRLVPDTFDSAYIVRVARVSADSTEAPSGAVTAPPASIHPHGGMPMGRPEVPSAPLAPARAATTRAHDHPSTAAAYACPMHPEVTDSSPSQCPKCGMTLVRQKEKP